MTVGWAAWRGWMSTGPASHGDRMTVVGAGPPGEAGCRAAQHPTAASVGAGGAVPGALYTDSQMAPLSDASAIRVALIDDDSGLVTVLDRRFAALRWERELLGYAPGPDHLAALRIHAAIVNPALTGL